MALFVSMAFAARWTFGSDSLGAIVMVGIGSVVTLAVLLWWSYWTDERVTPVEFNRRAAVETLATPLWQHVALFLVQVNCSVIAALAITIDGEFDLRDAGLIAQLLLLAQPILTVVGVGVSLWSRRLAASLLARTAPA
jgi:hypothetical protein